MVQTLDGGGRRNMYDPDELEDEQRERERRNKINNEFQQFVKRVQVGLWGSELSRPGQSPGGYEPCVYAWMDCNAVTNTCVSTSDISRRGHELERRLAF